MYVGRTAVPIYHPLSVLTSTIRPVLITSMATPRPDLLLLVREDGSGREGHRCREEALLTGAELDEDLLQLLSDKDLITPPARKRSHADISFAPQGQPRASVLRKRMRQKGPSPGPSPRAGAETNMRAIATGFKALLVAEGSKVAVQEVARKLGIPKRRVYDLTNGELL